MDKEIVLKHIQKIAIGLEKSNDYLTRSDLAYELKNYGVEQDSLGLNDLIQEAYRKDTSIKGFNRILSNDKRTTVINANKSIDLAKKDGYKRLISLAKDDIKQGGRSIEVLTNLIGELSLAENFKPETKFLQWITGTSGVGKVKEEAQLIFDGYSQVVDYYDNAKGSVLDVISDFALLRGQIVERYHIFSSILIDIFGDSICSIDPELFAYEQIEYLDVKSMLKRIELEYSKLTTECSQLMIAITDSFKVSLKNALSINNDISDKRVGLILAGLEMIGHYVDAHDRTLSLQKELSNLKSCAKKDVSQIYADMCRLKVIYGTIKDLYIPKAEMFWKYSEEILEEDMKKIIGAVYSTSKLQDLMEKRVSRMKDIKNVSIEILDAQRNISYYENSIADNSGLLSQLEDEYLLAKKKKPSKPFILFNLLTLGQSRKKYNRKIYEWNAKCRPVIIQFETLKVDLHIDEEELKKQKELLIELKNKNQKIKIELKKNSTLIKQSILADNSIKKELLLNMDKIVSILRVAKDIASVGLDTKLMKTVQIKDLSALTTEIKKEDSFQNFLAANRHLLEVNNDFAAASVNIAAAKFGLDTNREISSSDQRLVAEKQTQILLKGVDLLQKMREIELLQKQELILSEQYENEVKKIQDDFASQFADIQTKKMILKQLMDNTSSTQDKSEQRRLLLLLSGVSIHELNTNKWDGFLNGEQIINI